MSKIAYFHFPKFATLGVRKNQDQYEAVLAIVNWRDRYNKKLGIKIVNGRFDRWPIRTFRLDGKMETELDENGLEHRVLARNKFIVSDNLDHQIRLGSGIPKRQFDIRDQSHI